MEKLFSKAAIAIVFYNPETKEESTRRFNNVIEGATNAQVVAFQNAIDSLSALEATGASVIETYIV